MSGRLYQVVGGLLKSDPSAQLPNNISDQDLVEALNECFVKKKIIIIIIIIIISRICIAQNYRGSNALHTYI